MEKVQNERDRIGSTGERPIRADILNEQPVSPNDEGIVSVNPSSDAVIIGPSSNVTEQTKSSDTGQGPGSGPPIADFALQEQSATQTAYGSFTGTWDGYPRYLNIDGSHVISPVMYDDRSLVFHSGYGFNPEFAYGQYSPVATPMPSVMVDGQLYSPQQVPFSPSYYPQPAPPNLSQRSSAVPVQPTELIRPEIGNTENMLFGPGSGYLVNYGSLSGANFSGNMNSSPVTSHALYPQPIGILGSYEHSAGQISQQQRESHGYGLLPNSHYPSGTSYQRFSSRGASIPYPVANSQNQFTLDKGRRRDRDRDSNSMSNDVRDVMSEHNRGPRASRLKQKSASEQGHSSSSSKNGSSIEISLDLYNRPDFVTDYECAKFFVIKSFSEDNIHRSIKYNVWASTPHGNKKLDAAYHEAKGTKESCPVFLFFSVNGSGQFCGIAEMVGPVDFEKDAEYWQQDRWSGQFPVRWHIIKDVPNIRLRHILLGNNDNKPVTHSRDSQEVSLKQGIEVLRIFKDYDASTSLLDDFDFYNEREKTWKERKAKQQASSTAGVTHSLADDSIHEVSNSFAQGLKLAESRDLE